jgi:hypothetical protein
VTLSGAGPRSGWLVEGTSLSDSDPGCMLFGVIIGVPKLGLFLLTMDGSDVSGGEVEPNDNVGPEVCIGRFENETAGVLIKLSSELLVVSKLGIELVGSSVGP